MITKQQLNSLEKSYNTATQGKWEAWEHDHLEPGCRCGSCNWAVVWTFSNMVECGEVEPDRKQTNIDNSGCEIEGFIWKDAILIEEMHKFLPELISAARKYLELKEETSWK